MSLGRIGTVSDRGVEVSKRMPTNDQAPKVTRARIFKHSVEAEKSTFRGELSFQRSECTAGLTVATTFYAASKDYFV